MAGVTVIYIREARVHIGSLADKYKTCFCLSEGHCEERSKLRFTVHHIASALQDFYFFLFLFERH